MPLILISKLPVTSHANQQQKYQGDQNNMVIAQSTLKSTYSKY